MQNLLRVSERLPVPLEETFIEEEPEEEEICELIDEEEVEELSTEFPGYCKFKVFPGYATYSLNVFLIHPRWFKQCHL